jgi:hypothetical protein
MRFDVENPFVSQASAHASQHAYPTKVSVYPNVKAMSTYLNVY